MSLIDVSESKSGLFEIQQNFETVEQLIEGFTYEQSSPEAVWGPLAHGLGYIPSGITVIVGGKLTGAQVAVDATHITVTFNTPKSGTLRAR